MKTFIQFISEEEDTKHGVFAFGRFNPPTVGHEKLIHATEKVAAKHGVGANIIASHSEGTSKNPVPTANLLAYYNKQQSFISKVSLISIWSLVLIV